MASFASIRKALTPAALAVVAAVVDWIQTNQFDETALRLAVAGVVTALAVYFIPND